MLWNDTNNGLGAASNSFSDQVQIVNTTTGQTLASAAVLYNATSRGPLVAGGFVAQQYSLRLPNGAAGVGQLQVTVTNDVYNQVAKFNPDGTPEPNSTATVTATSTLGPSPDLKVQDGSLAVISPVNVQSGSPVTLGWEDQNIGGAAVTTSFSDYVLVQRANADNSPTDIASGYVSGNSSLAAGASSPQLFTFTLPAGATGVGIFQVTVTTDSGQTVQEFDSTGNPAFGNNSAVANFTSTLAPYPDLQVTGLAVTPGSPQSGQQLTINWNDTNTGDGMASGSWYDLVQRGEHQHGPDARQCNARRSSGGGSLGTEQARVPPVHV